MDNSDEVEAIRERRAKMYFASGKPTGAWAYVDDLLSLYDLLRAEVERLQNELTVADDALETQNGWLAESKAEVSGLSSEVGEVWEKAIAFAKKSVKATHGKTFDNTSGLMVLQALEAARDAAQNKNQDL